MTDKERDDALIAEKRKLSEVLEAITKLGTVGPWNDDLLRAVAILRGDERPKPDRAEVLAKEYYSNTERARAGRFSAGELAIYIRRHFDELRAEIEAERPAVVVPEETGWLVETKFGPHIHYMGIKDPHPYWRESRKKDEEFEPYGRRALVGLLSFNKDSNDGLRFARKVDAEAFIAAFGQLLTDPKATEHIWADKHLIDGAKGDE